MVKNKRAKKAMDSDQDHSEKVDENLMEQKNCQ